MSEVAGVEFGLAGFGNEGKNGDAIAGGKAAAGFVHDGTELVAKDEGVVVGTTGIKGPGEVAATDAAGRNADADGVGGGPFCGLGPVGMIDKVAGGFENEGAHGGRWRG